MKLLKGLSWFLDKLEMIKRITETLSAFQKATRIFETDVKRIWNVNNSTEPIQKEQPKEVIKEPLKEEQILDFDLPKNQLDESDLEAANEALNNTYDTVVESQEITAEN